MLGRQCSADNARQTMLGNASWRRRRRRVRRQNWERYMATLLIQHARLLATMDDEGSGFEDGAVYVEDNVIRQVGTSTRLPQLADVVINARDMVLLPGLVNTHHHF